MNLMSEEKGMRIIRAKNYEELSRQAANLIVAQVQL